ncbi:MAG: replication-associated recombination protein A [Parachlamydiales bacterium]|jgi:putative ATPase
MSNPLSDLLRPQSFEEVAGHKKELEWLKKVIKAKKPLSILFFGPPGCGKTTIAKLYAKSFNANFVSISAVFSSVGDIKKIVNEAKNGFFNVPTIIFVDEIHRFNKAQQDSFLPYLEDGTITLIAATTENPSFALNNALLSRLRVFSLSYLSHADMIKVLDNYEKKVKSLDLSEEAKKYLIEISQGDARHLLNMIENIQSLNSSHLDVNEVKEFTQKKSALYDKDGENHYNLISALHKSIRGSDPNASLYWLCRMLEGKEDPLYITRRLIRVSSEDIGLADPQALKIVLSADETYRRLGSPEGELAIAQAVVYLALAPKSNSIYTAFEKAKKIASATSNLPPPMHILNAPTKLMKDLGYSEGYVYDHDTKHGFSGQNYFPKELDKEIFYDPKEIGFERDLKKRILYFEKLKQINDEN